MGPPYEQVTARQHELHLARETWEMGKEEIGGIYTLIPTARWLRTTFRTCYIPRTSGQEKTPEKILDIEAWGRLSSACPITETAEGCR